jgi:hypothetical protein
MSARHAYEATDGAHGLCVLTDWDEFRTLDYHRVFDDMMRLAFIFDGRNVVDARELRKIGFVVHAVGGGERSRTGKKGPRCLVTRRQRQPRPYAIHVCVLGLTMGPSCWNT